jgi:DNA-binding IscR family transcriptional regulator
VEVVEGEIAPVPCTDDPEACARATTCVASRVWKRLADDMKRSLSSVTLADLVREAREVRRGATNYEI